MLRNIGPTELLILLLIAVLVFGAGRVGEIGGALGRSIREFRQELHRPDDKKEPEEDETAAKKAESKEKK
jgi:sec-independent protein translocase protein TatA